MLFRFLGAIVTTLGVAVVAAQTPPPPPATLPAPASEYSAYISLLDGRGAPVAAVAPSDLVLRAGGTSARILSVAPAGVPSMVTVLVDQCAPAVMELRDALTAFLRALAGPNQVALVTVDGPPTVLVPSTSDVAPLVRAVEGFRRRACLGLNVIDAIRDTYRSGEIVKADRAAVVAVVGHGADRSLYDVAPLLTEIRDGRAPLFVVRYVPEPSAPTGEQSHLAALLTEGAELSGGLRLDLLSPAALRGQLLKIAAILSAQHRVEFALDKEPPWNRPFRVEARASRSGFRALITGARRVP